jgi:ABC-2 type transport system ATP-binding protein
MELSINFKNISKIERGQKWVDQVTLQIAPGEIFGLIGSNGSGKTTLLKIAATLLLPTSGEGWVGGYALQKNPREIRRIIGYMPAEFGIDPHVSVKEYLDFYAACYHIAPSNRPKLINELLELVDLQHRQDAPLGTLSLGLKQRLSLARTLLHEPQILILDEPAAGMDPRGRAELLNLLVELANLGKTVFLSSHVMADVAGICTRLGIMEAGQLLASGKPAALKQLISPGRKLEMTVLDPLDLARSTLKKITAIHKVHVTHQPSQKRHKIEMEFDGDDATLSQVLAFLTKSGVAIIDFKTDDNDLTGVLMQATRQEMNSDQEK